MATSYSCPRLGASHCDQWLPNCLSCATKSFSHKLLPNCYPLCNHSAFVLVNFRDCCWATYLYLLNFILASAKHSRVEIILNFDYVIYGMCCPYQLSVIWIIDWHFFKRTGSRTQSHSIAVKTSLCIDTETLISNLWLQQFHYP